MSMIGNFKRVTPSMLEDIKKDSSVIPSIVFSEEEDNNSLDIDKAWHGIHFLLTGSPWEGELPLFNVILGGQEIGDDIGYGPARYLTPNEVKEVAEALAKIDVGDLEARFDADEFAELDIYPSIWEDEGEIDYLLGYYEELVKYYKEAAENGEAMLLYVT